MDHSVTHTHTHKHTQTHEYMYTSMLTARNLKINRKQPVVN